MPKAKVGATVPVTSTVDRPPVFTSTPVCAAARKFGALSPIPTFPDESTTMESAGADRSILTAEVHCAPSAAELLRREGARD